MVERRLEVAMRAEGLDRPVRDAREPDDARIVLDEPELEVRNPGRAQQHAAGIAARACAAARSSGVTVASRGISRTVRTSAADGISSSSTHRIQSPVQSEWIQPTGRSTGSAYG